MGGCTLTQRVEGIAFKKSALPASPASEKFLGMFLTLEEHFREKRNPGQFLFGHDSVVSNNSSVLVSNGWPPHTRIASSFAAAAAHSELGKVLRWFAGAVVGLFVNGVKSGVGFPQQWDEYLRHHAELMQYRFELQGFGVLFTYLICQLATVECAVSECGVSGVHCPQEGVVCTDVHSPDVDITTSGPEKDELERVRSADGLGEGIHSSRGGQFFPRRRDNLSVVGAVAGPSTSLKPVARHSSAMLSRALERRDTAPATVVSLGSGDENGSLVLGPSKPLASPTRGAMGTDSLSLYRCAQRHQQRLRLPRRSETPPGGTVRNRCSGSTSIKGSSSHALHGGTSSRFQSPAGDTGAGGLFVGRRRSLDGSFRAPYHCRDGAPKWRGEGNGANVGDSDNAESNSGGRGGGRTGRIPPIRPLPLAEVQGRMRSSELAKLYGVKSITNYAERDIDDFKEQMKSLRKLWEE